MTEPWLTDVCRKLHYEIVMWADGYNIKDNIGTYLYDEPLTFDDVYNAVRVLNGLAA